MGTKEFPSCQSFLIPLAAGTTSRKRGEQAGYCLGSTHEAGGWEGHLAQVEKAGGTPPDEQCGHTDRFQSRTTDSEIGW